MIALWKLCAPLCINVCAAHIPDHSNALVNIIGKMLPKVA